MIQYFIQNRGHLDGYSLLFLFVAYGILIGLILPFHEFAHALVAHWCGDDTAKYQGRLTLNPTAHLDLFGTLMMVLVGIGYAKPVPVNSYNLRNRKQDMMLIALAGPLSNLLMAVLAVGIFKVATVFVSDRTVLALLYLVLIEVIMNVNVSLAVFNLLPIPPLDGSRLWSTLLPGRWAFTLERYSRYITMGLLLLLLTGALDVPLNFLNTIFRLGIFRLFGLV